MFRPLSVLAAGLVAATLSAPFALAQEVDAGTCLMAFNSSGDAEKAAAAEAAFVAELKAEGLPAEEIPAVVDGLKGMTVGEVDAATLSACNAMFGG